MERRTSRVVVRIRTKDRVKCSYLKSCISKPSRAGREDILNGEGVRCRPCFHVGYVKGLNQPTWRKTPRLQEVGINSMRDGVGLELINTLF